VLLFPRRTVFWSELCSWIAIVTTIVGNAENRQADANDAPRVLTRLFFQDDDSRTLKWADLLAGNPPQLGTVAVVPGFPQIDPQRQSLVQMEAAEGMILVGVRDDDRGQFQSGWILVETGVEADEHGDHFHWSYPRAPKVRASVLDNQQGNPAHLYVYDKVFYIANDQKSGFTRLDPQGVTPSDEASVLQQRAVFYPGGSGHITLAAVDKSVVYATWNDREGEHRGKVDVTPLQSNSSPAVKYSFHLPHGGLHGATALGGKVFFAPSDGLCWVTADPQLQADPKQVSVQHLSLGKDGDRPRRTGAFTTFGQHVVFTMGSGPKAEVGWVDASVEAPAVGRLAIPMAEGNRPAGLELIRPRKGAELGFVFHNHPSSVEAPFKLTLFEVDPNRDGNWSDARVVQEMDVGRARVEGHGGHHSIAFDADRRRAIFTNPGDGTMTVLDLETRQKLGEFIVSGTPSKLLAWGGRASAD
jgi:hypothetical protein